MSLDIEALGGGRTRAKDLYGAVQRCW